MARPPLQAALNGSRRREEHPALPVTSWDLAQAATAAVAAGAGDVHIHVRNATGVESLAPPDVARAVDALRAAMPATPVSVGTGAWILHDTDRRHRLVAQWTQRPDAASVNFHEDGAERLAELLLTLGVGVDAGLSAPKAAERLVQCGLGPHCRRVLLEPPAQDLDVAREAVRHIEVVLEQAGLTVPRQLHGLDRTTWPLLADAVATGYEIRIGFEDTLILPDGSMAASNAILVAEACRLLRLAPR
jgi:uncharacterized protein (DUF849 family)